MQISFQFDEFFLDKKFQNSDFEVFDIFNKASYLKTYVYKLNIDIWIFAPKINFRIFIVPVWSFLVSENSNIWKVSCDKNWAEKGNIFSVKFQSEF